MEYRYAGAFRRHDLSQSYCGEYLIHKESFNNQAIFEATERDKIYVERGKERTLNCIRRPPAASFVYFYELKRILISEVSRK